MSQTTESPQTIYRKDYTPSPFLIDKVDLDFRLDKAETVVHAKLWLRRNPASADKGDLVLHGARNDAGSGDLVSIEVNGEALGADQYRLDDSSLTLLAPADAFVLETTRKLQPQENKSLEGLYASGSGLFTQCEAEGFRKITWFLDRPDVLSKFNVTLRAPKTLFPILLANGNKVSEHDEGDTRIAVWNDPWPKPSYLFALVAADLVTRQGHFTTQSGRKIELNVWVQAHDLDQTAHCMESLKKSMTWDEKRFGREYDLDVFNLVAVSDFNMGAMENKGLNIFNTKYVLARPDTATDTDFAGIEGVVGHEYFHNWSGNRVTCRDWFQLSLKEGFTVFRDQEFSSDVGSRAVCRIEEVRRLRSMQFPEDSGPTAHPVRPDSFVEISNFYTVTIYEKGAEVVRMLHTLLGEADFRKGTDLYFDRFDGTAATCDDFVSCMAEASGRDLSQFKLWYEQAGTPELHVQTCHDPATKRLHVRFEQKVPDTPGQSDKAPMCIPVRTALLDRDSKAPLSLCVEGKHLGDETVLELTQASQDFVFENVETAPVPSFLRGFSAPVKLHTDAQEDDLLFRLAHDDDSFNRVEASQELFLRHLESESKALAGGEENTAIDGKWMEAIRSCLRDVLDAQNHADPALLALALSVPSLSVIGDRLSERGHFADFTSAHQAREKLIKTLADTLKSDLAQVDLFLSDHLQGPYEFAPGPVGNRSLRNLCVSWQSRVDPNIPQAHLQRATNMTDTQMALALLSEQSGTARDEAFSSFRNQWSQEALMMDKWFTLQAQSVRANVMDDVDALAKDEAFSLKNPNRARALVMGFAMGNPLHFHDASGRGFRFLADHVIALDAFNPQIAARFLTPLTRWRKQDEARQTMMKSEIDRVLNRKECSPDVYEIASKALA